MLTESMVKSVRKSMQELADECRAKADALDETSIMYDFEKSLLMTNKGKYEFAVHMLTLILEEGR